MVQARVGVVIREVHGPAELRACQALQRRAWGITEDGYVLPVATMAGAQQVGGLVLGAFDATDARNLVGFAFAFLGRLDDRPVLYSQLAAVDPEHQSSGIGRRLKAEQRDYARALGLAAVVWAFDPLQASNAAFNLGVLGASSRRYEPDLYGSRSDALNAGLATDRLLAEWPTHGEPRGQRAEWPHAPDLIESDALDPDGRVRRPRPGCAPVAERVRLEVPADVSATKAVAGLAAEWQAHVRGAFMAAFAKGYVAVGFTRADPRRPRYLLERHA